MYRLLDKFWTSSPLTTVTLVDVACARQHLELPSFSVWTQFDHRAFLVCGPTIWNGLPKTLRLTDIITDNSAGI